VARHMILPPPVPAQRSRETALSLEVEWFLPENRERRNSNTPYWKKRQERHQELAGMAEEHLRAELELYSGPSEHSSPAARTKQRMPMRKCAQMRWCHDTHR
jgi:hypothetical protein